MSINNNYDLHQFLWSNLHDNYFNISSNKGLYWIWGNTISTLLIDFYKLMKEGEKFSFKKLINICNQNNESINYSVYGKKLHLLLHEYNEYNFEYIRSKLLAHQDLNVTEQRAEIFKINYFVKEVNDFFKMICSELKYTPYKIESEISKSLQEIFDRLDEFDKVSAYLIAKQLKGEKNLNFEIMKKELEEL